MRFGDLLDQAQKLQLRTEMEVFLSHLTGMSRLDLIAAREDEVPVEHLSKLQSGWAQIVKGYPVAYLTQHKEFFGLDLFVNESVLIPRDATECLVERVIEWGPSSILEIGTGSGAIAIALKNALPDARVMASDVSLDALTVARANMATHALDIETLQSDLLADLPQDSFEVLVTNLPYIGEEEHRFIDEKVEAYEPHLALFGGKDGLRLYARLFDEIQEQERDFSKIIGEIGFSQGAAIRELCEDKMPGWNFELIQDYEGLDRHFILTR